MKTDQDTKNSRIKRNIITALALTGVLAVGTTVATTSGVFASQIFPDDTPITSPADQAELKKLGNPVEVCHEATQRCLSVGAGDSKNPRALELVDSDATGDTAQWKMISDSWTYFTNNNDYLDKNLQVSGQNGPGQVFFQMVSQPSDSGISWTLRNVATNSIMGVSALGTPTWFEPGRTDSAKWLWTIRPGKQQPQADPLVNQVIGFTANVNGKYVTAENAGNSALIANRSAYGPWEKFMLLKNADNSYSLKALVNGKYVTAESAGESPLIANRSAIGPWEKFDVIQNADGSYTLKALVNGKYVTAEDAGNKSLIANRSAIGPWEKFTVIR